MMERHTAPGRQAAGTREASATREASGTVERALPRGLYRVSLDGGARVTAALSTRARHATARVVAGDRVLVEVSPLDPGRGRITVRSAGRTPVRALVRTQRRAS